VKLSAARAVASRAGMTLVEILIVIVLVSLVCAFAIPQMNRMQYRIDDSGKHVSNRYYEIDPARDAPARILTSAADLLA
jgi:prepilin-type N-terminal cleavage/methylation domain-containing protein